MKKLYEIYFGIHNHEALITVESDTREKAIKEATRQLFERHVLPDIKIFRANVKGRELPKPSGKTAPLPKIEVKVL
jgi:mannitol/fructose-specific phosphotransferase system IIA component (Ntr-type)